MTKHYLNDLLCAAAPEDGKRQEIIERAILDGRVRVTGDFPADVRRAVAQVEIAGSIRAVEPEHRK